MRLFSRGPYHPVPRSPSKRGGAPKGVREPRTSRCVVCNQIGPSDLLTDQWIVLEGEGNGLCFGACLAVYSERNRSG
jgi:hypothetical protein